MTSRSPFRRDIQGLRALAVSAVVLQHAGVPGVSGGFIGVDVFFVVSGFLITRMLVRELLETGRIDLGAFLAQRARRLLPAAWTVIILTTGVGLLVVAPLARLTLVGDAVASTLFFPNYLFAARGADYFGDADPSLFQHYWSLGVEEQWYLLAPGLLWGCAALVRGRGRGTDRVRAAVVAFFVLVGVASFTACVILTPVSQPWAFFSLWTRAWEFAAGALIALTPERIVRRLPQRAAIALGWAGLVGIVAAALTVEESAAFPGLIALWPVVATAAVVLAGSRLVFDEHLPRVAPSTFLGVGPLVFLGTISYSVYLVHWPLSRWGEHLAASSPALIGMPYVLAASSVPLAWCLYRFVEAPVRYASWLRSARPRRTLLSAAGTGAMTAMVGVVLLLILPMQTLTSRVSVEIEEPTAPPAATSVVPRNVSPTLDRAGDDEDVILTNGCNLGYREAEPRPCRSGAGEEGTLVLWGDSHAAHWASGVREVAAERGMSFVSQTKSRCSSAFSVHDLNGEAFAECDQWRQGVLDDLRASPPEILVVSNYARETLPVGTDPVDAWREGLSEIVDALPRTDVVLLADTPYVGFDPLDCLSERLENAVDCAPRADEALGGVTRGVLDEVAATTSARVLDLSAYFCTAEVCPVIIGGRVVYRDQHHLTATFARAMSAAFGAELDRVLAEHSGGADG